MIARRTVQHVRRSISGVNTLGQPLFDTTIVERNVYGWQPVSDTEHTTAELAGRVITELKLLAPQGDWSADDEVIIGENLFTVVGEPENYNTGPFADTDNRWVVALKRVAH